MALSHLSLLRPVLCRFLPSITRTPLVAALRVPSLPRASCPMVLPNYIRHYATKKSKGALDHITVTTKDGKFPLNQLGQISMKSPQLLVVNMTGFPEALAAVTSTLQDSSMGLNPEVEGTIIRVPIPKVTREHRENLVKLAKQFSNKAKDSLRRVRSNAVSQVKKSKEGISEDTIRLIEKQVQQMADSFAADIDKQLATKTKELLG
ncbi:ribosome-recycling factor, mitochondrial isoform X2 [Myxocyprinus asiaticus]|uniref:ribosome-recycling factor, mitochondrial isoform X2 n=1 Tax=Myxocyprinus asiaticus TaxID=70543 RepID=UPI002223A04C|nr:ribosome-recycling factor, mitochondrial isoform X2 [Myxocyprinus asiaticus]